MYSRSIKLTIESKMDDIALLAQAIKAICHTAVQDETLLYNIVLCLVEAVTNIIKHAYHLKPGNYIDVKVTINEQDVWFEISDDGEIVNLPPPKKELHYDSKDILSVPESGLGLFLIHQIMEDVSLNQSNGKNILSMRKHLSKPCL